MTRSRASAKAAGTRFESLIAQALADFVDPRIERRVQHGRWDRGDIAGLGDSNGNRIVVECKDYGGKFEVGAWLRETETERLNGLAEVGLVIAKRRGTGDPLEQVVLMTLADLVCLLTGERP